MDKDVFSMGDEELLKMADQSNTDDFTLTGAGEVDTTTSQEIDTGNSQGVDGKDTLEGGVDTLESGTGEDTTTGGEYDPNDFKLDRTGSAETLEDKLNSKPLKDTVAVKQDAETKGGEASTAKAAEVKQEPVNYEESYNKLMGEFVANGKKFKPSSVEEAISLMQMGTNYTKKMQDIAPSLKLVKLLKDNNINDANDIGFLIDLKNHKKDAVEKLLLDSKIDPLDLNTERGRQYKTTVPQVDEGKQALQTFIDEVVEFSETGAKTVETINTTWDLKSKQELLKEPKLVKIMDAQRQNGIYDTIVNEMERRQILGQMSRNISFLEAYQSVGDELNAAGKFNKTVNPSLNTNKVLGTGINVKPQQRDTTAAARASAAPTAQVKSKQTFDPTKMSDEEIMKFIK